MPGAVTVSAGALSIVSSATIASNTFNSGSGGSVTVTVKGQLTIDGAGAPDNLQTGIAANSEAGSTNNAGEVTVAAGALSIVDGGSISSKALHAAGNLPASTGNAGSVSVNVAGLLSVDGATSQITTSVDPGTIGNAGSVAVTASQIMLTNDATISSATFGSGAGGSVTVDAGGALSVDGSEISASAELQSSGNAGDLVVNAASLALTDGGQISTRTFGAGNGGTVLVNIGGALSIDGLSGIAADAGPQSSGNAGNLTVEAASLSLSNGSIISSSTAGPGNGGTVSVTVPGQLTIAGSGLGSGISVGTLQGSRGNAGNLSVSAGNLSITDFGEISANTFGQGRGGDVSVDVADNATLNGGGIDANAEAGSSGNAGNLSVAAGTLSIADNGFRPRPSPPAMAATSACRSRGRSIDGGGIKANAEAGSPAMPGTSASPPARSRSPITGLFRLRPSLPAMAATSACRSGGRCRSTAAGSSPAAPWPPAMAATS